MYCNRKMWYCNTKLLPVLYGQIPDTTLEMTGMIENLPFCFLIQVFHEYCPCEIRPIE